MILALLGALIYKMAKKEETPKPPEETLTEKQIRELEALRGESKPLTEEEIKTQSAELDKLRENSKPLSQEEKETEQQLEELNNLRAQ